MPTIDFPTSPSLNQTYTFNGKTWKWNGAGWEAVISTLVQIDTQTFTSSTTYTIPAGAQFILVECVGAGGGGDGNGNAGAGGGYWQEWVPVSTLTSPVTVTIGAGGTGVSTYYPSAGAGQGGESRFGTSYFPGAPGGGVGSYAYGGTGFSNSFASLGGYTFSFALGSGGPQYFGNTGDIYIDAGADNYKGGGGGGRNGYAGGKSYSNAVPVTIVYSLAVPTSGNGAAAGANGTGSDGGGGGIGSGNGGNGGTPGGGGGAASGGGTGGNGGNAQIKIWVYG